MGDVYVTGECYRNGTSKDYAYSIIQITGGGYVVPGKSNSYGAGGPEMTIRKLDANQITSGNSTSPSSYSSPQRPIVTAPPSIVNRTSLVITNSIPTVNNGGVAANIYFVVGIETQNELPNQFRLYQNYPNPFNPVIVIEYDLPERTHAKLIIYDLNGRKIMRLVNEELQPGRYKNDFDGSNLNSGIYFYK